VTYLVEHNRICESIILWNIFFFYKLGCVFVMNRNKLREQKNFPVCLNILIVNL
jgi:hypothetical protein